ncbi:protein kinase domain-containing protein [Chitinilyticum piscinae]|uniref:Protein kinase n=1 Tax=Chitinilyticum piscinae TaxID=2866724 RepID=A0A8J7FFK6_9NEIS|nr:serine/threonine-protein kinase [Chitinilyticum piscinae]MBE9608095.1 protein kinase [Chitinilyticum piscinae]
MQIGKYQIQTRLGGGATADVYRAWDAFLNREVAIKLFRAETTATPGAAGRIRRMFLNEARLVRELNHPCIVATLDAVQDGQQAYVVMEYVDGAPLSEYTQPDTLLPIDTVLQIGFQCCMAMHHANQQGLVHRDLKPANLLLAKSGDVKITDFGASCLLDGSQTELTGMVGTPDYMSPELIAGQDVDARSDMFGLGVVLYELLTGCKPFQGDTVMSTLYQISHAQQAPLRSRRPELPPALEFLLDIALQKDPEARFPSWLSFAEHLSAIDQAVRTRRDELSDREKFLLLRQCRFFRIFSDAELWQVLRIASWHLLPPGRTLMQEDRPGNSFSILLQGKATVSRGGIELATLRAGECMGEMAYLTPDKPLRRATITSAGSVLVLKFRRASIESASLQLQSRFEQSFLRLLVERLEAANEQLAAALD